MQNFVQHVSILLSIGTLMIASFGCASKVYVPGNRFLAPESSGGFLQGDFKIGGMGVTHVQVADDTTSTSPDTTPITLKNSTAGFNTQIGLMDRVDTYFTSGYNIPTTVGVKIQILGDSMPTAKAGNFSLALAGGTNNVSTNNSSSSVNEIKGSSTFKFGGWEAMAILGWRPNDAALIYVSPFKNTLTADIKIERTENGTTTTTAQPDGSGEMKGASVGVRLGKSVFVNGEVSYTETVWTRKTPTEIVSDKFVDTALGLAVGGSW